MNTNGSVKFGVFEFHQSSGELRRNGTKIKLQDQPGQILSALLERPGDVVSREELRNRLWPADTFVDFDHSLNTAIKRLRDALGDSADNPIFVETLARRGYRFMAPLHANGHGAGVNAVLTASTAAGAARRFSARVLGWVATGLVLTAGAVSAGWHAGHRAVRTLQPREIRLTTNSADAPVENGSISPDGRLLVYNDSRGTYVKDTVSGEMHPLKLPQDFTVTWASWFPDQSHLLASAVTNVKEKPAIWKLSILGGAPQRLMDDGEFARVSPDGRKVVFVRGEFPQREIWVMNEDGSEPRKEVEAPGYFLGPPVWSADSRMLAYLRVIYYPSWSDEDVNLETHFVGSEKSQVVIADRQLSGGLAWLADGRLFFTLAEAAPAQGDTNLWGIPINMRTGTANGERVRITNGPDHKPAMDVSADGKKVLFLRTNIQPAVYVADIDPKTKLAGWPKRLTLDDRKNLPYEWTPDGKSVIYISNREGRFHIYKQEVGGGSPEMLDSGPEDPNILRLNPDGSEILFTSVRRSNQAEQSPASGISRSDKTNQAENPGDHEQNFDMYRLLRIPINGGKPELVLEEAGINNFQCARSPSHECVYSKFTKEALEFYEFDSKSGKSTLMFRIADPVWQLYNWSLSPNGELLALAKKLRAQDEAEIQILSVKGGSTRRIGLKEWRSVNTIDWAADSKSIWASASPRPGEEELINVDLQGHVKPAVRGTTPYVGWAIPSPDGKRLAIWEASGASNVWMLEGF